MLEELASSRSFLIIVGFCSGILSGLLGVGSGILLIPTLVFLLSLPQKSAQGICLAVMVPMTLIGAIRYKINPNIEVNLSHAAWLALGAVAGAFIGTELVRYLSSNTLRKIFAVFILIVGVKMLLTTPKRGVSADANLPQPRKLSDESLSNKNTISCLQQGQFEKEEEKTDEGE